MSTGSRDVTSVAAAKMTSPSSPSEYKRRSSQQRTISLHIGVKQSTQMDTSAQISALNDEVMRVGAEFEFGKAQVASLDQALADNDIRLLLAQQAGDVALMSALSMRTATLQFCRQMWHLYTLELAHRLIALP